MAFPNSIFRMTMMLQATERRVWFLYSDRIMDEDVIIANGKF